MKRNTLGGGLIGKAFISADVIRGYVDLMILRVLMDGDSYGYEISKKITAISQGMYSMKETTLYSAFSRIEKSGAVQSYPGTVTGGRERIYYRLTPTGYEIYAQKCKEWAITQPLINKFIMEEYKNGNN